MNEAEYLMKNYGDRGGCYPSRPSRITPAEISIILHMIRKPNSITVNLLSSEIKEFTKAVVVFMRQTAVQVWSLNM